MRSCSWISRPRAVASSLVAVLIALSACSQSNVSSRGGKAQEQARAQTPIVIEPAIPAPSQSFRAGRHTRLPGEPIKIGLLLPLSGPEESLGRSLLSAAQLALFDIAGDDFVVVPLDTKGTADGAAAAARQAVEQRVAIILGPVFSTSVRAVTPIARPAGINVVAFSNNRAVADDGTFLLGLLPRQQIRRVVGFAQAKGVERFAALVPDTAFGKQVEQYFTEAVAEVGGTVAKIERYYYLGDESAAAVKRLANYDERQALLAKQREALTASGVEVTKEIMTELAGDDELTDLGFDALLIAVSGEELKEVAALLPFYDIDTKQVKVLGLSSWQVEGLGRERPLVGAWFAAPSKKPQAEFAKRFKRTYGTAPDPLAMLAYDAAALAAILAQSDSGPDFTVAALTSESGFLGTAGIFRFLDGGESERGLSIFEVRRRDVREIQSAPNTFEALTN